MKKIDMKRIALIFGIALATFSCQEEEVEPTNNTTNDPNNGGGGGSTGPSSYYISYDDSGTSFIDENGVDNTQLTYANSSEVDAPNDNITVAPGSGLYNFGTEDNSFINFKGYNFVLSTYSNDATDALASIFTVGSHNYTLVNSINTGVEISLKKNGVYWKSSKQIQPSGASFSITESVGSTNSTGDQIREVKGTYNCTLFSDAGDSKVVTNGKFHLIFSAP